MNNRRIHHHRPPHEPLLGAAFDDWIDEKDEDPLLAMVHFMAGAGAVVGLIQHAYANGRTDAASRVFHDLLLEIKAFSLAAQKTAEALEEEN
jgi:hypothetical protein